MDIAYIKERLGRRLSLQSMPRVREQLDTAMRDTQVGVDELAEIISGYETDRQTGGGVIPRQQLRRFLRDSGCINRHRQGKAVKFRG
jgi:hypothetical protein